MYTKIFVSSQSTFKETTACSPLPRLTCRGSSLLLLLCLQIQNRSKILIKQWWSMGRILVQFDSLIGWRLFGIIMESYITWRKWLQLVTKRWANPISQSACLRLYFKWLFFCPWLDCWRLKPICLGNVCCCWLVVFDFPWKDCRSPCLAVQNESALWVLVLLAR